MELVLDLLHIQLDECEKALKKSYDFLRKNQITADTHREHRINLIPKIREYRKAIVTLKREL